jgi:hypothetical protein
MDIALILVFLSCIYFVGFISGYFVRAMISMRRRREAYEARHAARVDGSSSAHRAVSARPSEKDSLADLLTRFAPHTLALTSKGRST